MLHDIPSPMNNVINNQLTLQLLDISLDNMSQISCKSFLWFSKIWKIGYSKVAKIAIVQLKASFVTILIPKSMLSYASFKKNERNSENSTKAFYYIVDQTLILFWDTRDENHARSKTPFTRCRYALKREQNRYG